ncbi:hypothetical protein [Microbacterium sp. GXS0129]|uniref:hypothetical protein n=1 Tax=Microbacterium sp. GXS0129 TaxID=3377836 RepID=UPI00383ADB06
MTIYNNRYHLDASKFPVRIPLDELRFYRVDGVRHYVSDVNLLLNAERIKNRIGEDTYMAVIKNAFNPKKTPYVDSKFSDEQLMESIKPRFVQAPCEIKAWTEHLISQLDDIITDEKERSELKSRMEQEAKDAELRRSAFERLANGVNLQTE